MVKERPTTIILMRHGEATHNTGGLQSGLIDSELTPRGHEQAVARGQQLRRDGYNISAVYTSMLKRTRQTAEGVLEGAKITLPIQQVDGLQERYFGDKAEKGSLTREGFVNFVLSSVDKDKINAMSPRELDNLHLVPGMESNAEVKARMKMIINSIAERNSGQTVAVFSHGNVMRTFLVDMGVGTYQTLPSGHLIQNTGYVVLQTYDNGQTFSLLERKGIDFAKPNLQDDQTDIYIGFQTPRRR